MKLLIKAGAILDYLNDFLIWLADIILVLAWFAVCFEVLMRYFLNRPTTWTIEITQNILVWVTFLGTAWLLRRDGHVKIDFLVARLKPSVYSIINGIASILCAIACLIVAWYATEVVWEQFMSGVVFSTILELPKAPLFAIIPIAFFLLCIQFLRRSYGYLTRRILPQTMSEGSTAQL